MAVLPIAWLVLSMAAGQAAAQTAAPPAAPPPPPVERPAAPYEPQLLRLSEILGALAYLRELCGGEKEGDELRKQMAALIEAEASSAAHKARFAGAYNKGFRGFEQTYHACTPNAEIVVARYLAEGLRIARETASRFGGG